MSTRQLWSVDWSGDFGFFRKPDINDGIQLSYNMLHKPALLGMLGAVLGLPGYRKKGEWPVYYEQLKHIPIGLAPLEGRHELGNFSKTNITYTNTVGYANLDGNLIVHESTLIAPAYRVFLLLDTDNRAEADLLRLLQSGESYYIPYFGKNEFPAAWSSGSLRQYDVSPVTGPIEKANILTLLSLGDRSVWGSKAQIGWMDDDTEGRFMFFERLPVGFDEQLRQYRFRDFAYTNYLLTLKEPPENLWQVDNRNEYVYLF